MAEPKYADGEGGGGRFEGYFERLPTSGKAGGLNLKFFLLLVAGAAVAIAVAWYALSDQYTVDPNTNVPIIRADFGPVKVRPESPGGMTVPDRDKLVYDRLKGDGERPVVERLLPPSEVPLPPPVPTRDPGPTADIPVILPEEEPSSVSGPMSPAVTDEVIVLQKVEPAAQLPKKEAAPEQVAALEPKTAPVSEPKALVPAKEEAAAVKLTPILVPTPKPQTVRKSATGGYLVQLSAARSDKLARREWKRLQAKHKDLLGGLTPTITRVDLGAEKGIYYRLRTGPFATDSEARGLCATLTKRKAGCLVVKIKG